jgi:hypothetical protein
LTQKATRASGAFRVLGKLIWMILAPPDGLA